MIKISFCRFDGKEFLTEHKGKQMMFVGDSVSLNQWQSLVCLLRSSVPQTELLEQADLNASNYTFPVSDISLHKHFSDCANFFSLFEAITTTMLLQAYNVSVIVFHTTHLVDIEVEKIGRVLKLDSLKSGSIWKDMDIVVFNTWLWWYRRGPKQP